MLWLARRRTAELLRRGVLGDDGGSGGGGSAQLDGLVVEGSDIVQRAVLY